MSSASKTFSFILLLVWNLNSVAGQLEGKITKQEYINKYYHIAVAEMQRVGIPASITLSQGILESGYGNSELARKANNHFGIKCHKEWRGKSMRMDDDARNECFRKYNSAEESFADHSTFLTTRGRYAFLFRIDPQDYKAWARGLKKAGYATNPQYASRLITLIEEFDLTKFDKVALGLMDLPETVEQTPAVAATSQSSKVFQFNGLSAIHFGSDDNLFALADRNGLPLKSLLKYNDLKPGQDVEPGVKIYLQRKRGKGKSKVRKVQPGESLYDISQSEGVRMKSLRKKNRIPEGAEPADGETIYLRSKRSKTPRLKKKSAVEKMNELREERFEKARNANAKISKKTRHKPKEKSQREIIETKSVTEEATVAGKTEAQLLEEVHSSEAKNADVKTEVPKPTKPTVAGKKELETLPVKELNKPETANNNYREETPTMQNETGNHHLVVQGETLWSISQKHNVSVADLKKWNNLTSNEVNIGEYLVIKEKADAEPVLEVAEGQYSFSNPVEDESGNVWHMVVEGQTLYCISVKYKTSVAALRELNNLTVNDGISPDQKLMVQKAKANAQTIPQAGQATSHTVQTGETLYSISRQNGVSVSDLRLWNELDGNNLEVGQRLKVKP